LAPLVLAVLVLAPLVLLEPFFAPLFAELDLDEDVLEDFAAVRDDEPALFFAPDFAEVFRPLAEPRFALLLFADDEADPLLPAPLVLISLVLDLSSVGIAASFKDLHVQPSRLHKATSLYQASSGYRKVSEVERVRFLWILLFIARDRLASTPRNRLRNQTHLASPISAAACDFMRTHACAHERFSHAQQGIAAPMSSPFMWRSADARSRASALSAWDRRRIADRRWVRRPIGVSTVRSPGSRCSKREPAA
jgi:hypothetical protein